MNFLHKLWCVTVTVIPNYNSAWFISQRTNWVWRISVEVVCVQAAHISFFMHCCVVLLTLCSSVTRVPTVPALHSTITILFSSKCLEHSLLPPSTPTPTWLSFICHFFFSRSPASHLLSVSIGGHGLGKPTERLQNVEELLLFFLLCQHGGWWHQLSIEYPILSLFLVFSSYSSLSHTYFPPISFSVHLS